MFSESKYSNALRVPPFIVSLEEVVSYSPNKGGGEEPDGDRQPFSHKPKDFKVSKQQRVTFNFYRQMERHGASPVQAGAGNE